MSQAHNEFSGTAYGSVAQVGHVDQLHIHPPAPPTTALAGLPADESLTGRDDELATLATVLTPESTTTVCAVAGLAGVGKTALVVKAARLAADGFPGGVLFVDLHGYDPARRLTASAALSTLLRALGVPGEQVPPDQDDREVLYRSVLASEDQPVLIVADNVATLDQVLPLRPGTAPHRMLVSSRHTLPIPDARRIELDVLPTETAIEVLARATRAANPDDTRITAEPDAAAELVRLCGGLPLALRITAELLADQPGQPVAELVAILSAERNRLGELAYGDSIAVRTAFDASYRHLPPDQARLFRLLALNPGPHIGLDAAAALADAEQDVTRRMLDGLRRAHLIQPGAGGYRMHDLLRLYAGERVHQEESDRTAAVGRLLDTYRALVDAADGHLDPRMPADERSPRFTDRGQAIAWLDAQRPNLVAAVQLAADEGHDDAAVSLPLRLQSYFDLRSYMVDQMTTSAIAVAAAQRLGDLNSEAAAINSIGVAHWMSRRFTEAAESLRRAGELYGKVGNREGMAAALTNLANTEDNLDRFDDAVGTYEAALALYRGLGDPYGVAITLANLGGTYARLGRDAEALDHYQRAAAYFVGVGDHHGEGKILANAAQIHYDLGHADEAEAAWRRAAMLQGESGDVVGRTSSLTDLGAALAALGRFADAVDVLREAVAIRVELGDRFEEGQTMTRLGIVYWQAGRFADAMANDLEVLAIHQETQNTFGAATILSYIGLAHVGLGERDEALACYQRSITLFREIDSAKEADDVAALVAQLAEQPAGPQGAATL